jgi:putative endonuclease
VHDLQVGCPLLNEKLLQKQTSRHKGLEIETVVADYLKQKKVQILHRNFRCRLGEIDLIGNHQHTLVFIEVRYRSNPCNQFGTIAESITFSKQQKIIRTAGYFLAVRPTLANYPCRFDVVTVTLLNNEPQIEWIPNAFC